MRNVIKLEKTLSKGERFCIVRGNTVLELIVLGIEQDSKSSKTMYWVGVCLK